MRAAVAAGAALPPPSHDSRHAQFAHPRTIQQLKQRQQPRKERATGLGAALPQQRQQRQYPEQPLPPLPPGHQAAAAAPPPQQLARRQLGAVALAASAAACWPSAAAAAAAAAAAEAAAVPAASPVAAASGRLREVKVVMRVAALRGSVPQQWVSDFKTSMEGYGMVALTPRAQLTDIYADLRGSSGSRGAKGRPSTVDAATVGDTWLQRAIQEGLVQPLQDATKYRWWGQLSPRWRQLVRRDVHGMPDPRGEVWGCPYRWGCTLIAYRKDKLLRWGGRPIQDWADLLQPQLRGQVAFADSPREVVGAALKSLGLSCNATAADMARCGLSEQDVRARVQRLVGQVRVFSNTDHVRALAAGEVAAVVGWSEDILPLALRSANLEAVAPLSGTSLWADLWCAPSAAAGGAKDGEPSPLLPAWLELGLQPVHAQYKLLGGTSPLLLPDAPQGRQGRSAAAACSVIEERPQPGGGSSDLLNGLPSEAVLQRSEFVLPIDADTSSLHRRLLQA